MVEPIAGSIFLGYLLIIVVVTVVSFTAHLDRSAKVLAWRAANAATILSAVSIYANILWPNVWMFVFANLVVIFTGLIASYAILLITKRKLLLWLYAAILVPLLAAFAYFLLVENHAAARTIVSGVLSSLLAVYMAVELGIAFWRQRNRFYLILAVVSLAALAGQAYRIYFAANAGGLSEVELHTAVTWLALAVNLFLFVSWNIIFYILIIDDYQRQLRNSEQRFRLVVENSPNPIMIWDKTGALTYVSPMTQTMLGYDRQKMMAGVAGVVAAAAQVREDDRSPDQLVAAGVTHRLIAESWLQALDTISRCIAHPGVKVQAETYLLDVAGSLHTLVISAQGYARNAVEFEVVSVAHDITELRNVQQLLQETNAALEQQVAARTADLQATVSRLQATMTELQLANAGKDAFLAAVSHELRTPLTAVLSMSELLEAQVRGPLNPDQAKYVAAIHKGGRRLLATVDSILLYTSLLAGELQIEQETCCLAELCAIAIHSIKSAAERKRQHITQTVEPAALTIESYAQGIVQMLKILLDNAVKFTPEEGRIDVLITAGTAATGAKVVYLAVSDNGIGMDEEQQAALFRPFTQGDLTLARRYEGLGLSLAYVHKLSERMGGSVAAVSRLGEGSCFTITLPVCPCHTDGRPTLGEGNLVASRSVIAAL